ncbi:MAG: GNAT family N-acetyltransferase [Candidatus Dormibacteria bacterium]
MTLLNENLGDPIFSSARLQEGLDDPSARLEAAHSEGRLVGAALSRLLEPGDVDYYRRFGPEAADLFQTGPIGSLEALAVTPSARRRGAGRALLDSAVAWCQANGCRKIVAVSWISGASGTSAQLFAAAGFTMGETIPGFYLEESLRDGWNCPVCGAGCKCGGQFVYLRRPA